GAPAREPAREAGRELGSPTSLTRCRRESSTLVLGVGKRPSKRRIQLDWLFSSCRYCHDLQSRTPTAKNSIGVLSCRLDDSHKPFSQQNLFAKGRWLHRFSPDGYLLGSYRIATAPELNSSRFTSLKSTGFDSP